MIIEQVQKLGGRDDSDYEELRQGFIQSWRRTGSYTGCFGDIPKLRGTSKGTYKSGSPGKKQIKYH